MKLFHCSLYAVKDCFIEIHNGDAMTGYQEGEDITLYLEHNCSKHRPVCTWDNIPNKIEIITQSQNISQTSVESTLIISGTDAVVGVHSVFCSLANNKNVSTLITVTSCKSLQMFPTYGHRCVIPLSATPSPTLTPSSLTIRQATSIMISSILDSPRPTATGTSSPGI